MLKINNLTKSFDGKKVLDNYSIDFPDKGFIAICGPSGCGKTTFLKIIADLEKYDSGEVVFFTKKPKVSMAFQETRLLSERTARENVNLVLGDKKATLPVAEELLNKLGISDTSLYPDELSGGMKQRVSLARAFLFDAPILLLDEPTKELDPSNADTVRKIIKEQSLTRLVILVSHNGEDIDKLGATKINLH